jgi:hypothetical protein
LRVRFENYFASLVKEVKGHLMTVEVSKDEVDDIAKTILKVEAAAYGLMQLLPEEMWTFEQLSYLYSGTYLSLFQNFSDRQMRIWSNLKILLPSWKARSIVTNLCEEYFSLQVPQTLLHLLRNEERMIWKNLTQYPDRTSYYEQLLTGIVPHVSSNRSIAQHNVVTKFKDIHQEISFKIPEYIHSSEIREIDTDYLPKEVLSVTKEDLLESAKKLDNLELEILGEYKHQWCKRIKPIIFNECTKSKKRTDILFLSGTQHWVGTLSAGKSTIMDLLAFHLYENKKVTTLIVGDVATALKKVDYFQSLGIKAVPIISYRQRKRHVHEYMQTMDESFMSLRNFQKPAMRYLSDICIIQEKQELNLEGPPPCFNMRQNNKVTICPYFFRCPYHHAYHDLSEADILIATIQGLVYSEMPSALAGIRMRMFEYVYRRTSLILIDEADRVQSQLDAIFAPEEEIAGSQTSWLEQLHKKINEQLYKSKLSLRKPTIDKWNRALQNAMSAVYLAYSLLQQERDIYTFVGKQYFTSYKLLKQFTLSLLNISGKDEKYQENPLFKRIWKDFNDFVLSYQKEDYGFLYSEKLEKKPSLKLLKSITNQLIQDDEESSVLIREWLELTSKRFNLTLQNRRLLEKKLRFALTILLLEKYLFYLVQHFDTIQSEFEDMDIDNMLSIFQGTPKDYDGLLPVSPTGIGMGFRYESEEHAYAKGGILKLVRIIGVGRYLLTHMDKFFYPLDGKKGATVILLSGTSEAPFSSKYQIQLPVSYLIEKNEEVQTKIEVIFEPLYKPDFDPIIISGKKDDERDWELKSAVASLKRNNIIERELELASEGRKRLLIVVGSYEEAAMVGKEMRNVFDRKDIYYLTNQNSASLEEGVWPRQKVASFSKSNGVILVAPLLALERGHNILSTVDSMQVAAFHTAIFLVRPYPRPYDMSRLINRLNAYIMNELSKVNTKDYNIKEQMLNQRKAAYAIQKEILLNERGFRYLDNIERKYLIMDLFVSVWQLTGRLIRGNVPAKIILCDGSFAPETVIGNADDYTTSLLVAWKEEIVRFAKRDNYFILQKLYHPIMDGLQNLKGVKVYDENKRRSTKEDKSQIHVRLY